MKVKSKLLSAVIAGTVALTNLSVMGTMPDTFAAENDIKYDDYLYYSKIDFDNDSEYDYVAISDCERDAVSVDIPEEIEGLPVKVIDKQAFYGNTNLTSVSIPETVTVIGDNAFARTKISTIQLPTALEEIGNTVFYSTNLTEIKIPDTVKSVGSDILHGTPLLKNQSGLKYADTWLIGYEKNDASAEIKDGTRGIAKSAFAKATALEEVTLPDSIEIIDEDAFNGCTKLKSITLPNGITAISDSTFKGCSALESITFPESVTAIGKEAFESCSGLKSIIIPETVTAVGKYAFNACKAIESITIENPELELTDWGLDNNVTIYGYRNSKARTFADEYNYSFEALDTEPEETEPVVTTTTAVTTSVVMTTTIATTTTEVSESTTAETTTIKDEPSYTPEIRLLNAEGAPGETVCVDFSVLCNDSLGSMDFSVIWDDEQLEAVNVSQVAEDINLVHTIYSKRVDIVFYYAKYKMKDGVLLSIDFKIPEDAKSGTAYNLNLNTRTFAIFSDDSDFDHDIFDYNKIPAVITVVDKKTAETTSAVTTKINNVSTTTATTLITQNEGEDGKFNVYDSDNDGVEDCAVISSYKKDTKDKNVEIPNELGSYPVKYIWENAFEGCETIESIELPDNLIEIKMNAFKDCKGLKNINLPEGLETIGTWAFLGCENLKNITVPKSVNKICVGAFGGCKNLESITILNPNCEFDNEWGGFISNRTTSDYHETETGDIIWGTHTTGAYYDGIIYGYKGSTAEEYANTMEPNCTFIALDDTKVTTPSVTTTKTTSATTTTTTTTSTAPKTPDTQQTTATQPTATEAVTGDANGDNKLNVRDAAHIAKMLAQGKAKELPPEADFNGDGKVNVRDAAAIAKYLATGKR